MRLPSLALALAVAGGCATAPGLGAGSPTNGLPPVSPLADARAWTWLAMSAVFDGRLPAPADALGEYFVATPDWIMVLRGPAFDELCHADCSVPYAPRIGSQFFYVAADRHPVVIAWDAVTAALRALEVERGAEADHDPEVVAFRAVVATHRLPAPSQAWLLRQPDGSLEYHDWFPLPIELDPRLPVDARVTAADPLPIGVVVSGEVVRARLSRGAAGLAGTDRIYLAAIGMLPAGRAKVAVRALASGWLVSIVGPCPPGWIEVFVDADVQLRQVFSQAGGSLHAAAFGSQPGECR